MAIRRQFQRVQSFILTWPGDVVKPFSYDGMPIILPPIDEVAEVRGPLSDGTPGTPYRHEAAVLDGSKLAGTIVVSDIVSNQGGTGAYVKIFDAAEFCHWLEHTRDDLFDQGLAICMDPSEVAKAHAEGRPKWERAQDAYAEKILQDELSRRQNWEAKGIPPPRSSSEGKVLWAAKHLETRRMEADALSNDAIRQALGGAQPTPPTVAPSATPAPAPDPVPPTHELALSEPTSQEVYRLARELGVNVTKNQMEGLFVDDADWARAEVLAKIDAEKARRQPEEQPA